MSNNLKQNSTMENINSMNMNFTTTSTTTSFPLADSEYWAYATNTVNGCVGKHFKGVFSKEEKEDIVGEVVSRMWSNRESFDPTRGNLSQWVWTITKNVVLTHAKKKNCRRGVSLELKEGEYSDSTSFTKGFFDDFYSTADFSLRDEIEDYMHKLDPKRDANGKLNRRSIEKSEKEKKVLKWIISGYEADEIAEMLGTTTNAVYVLTHNIRKKLAA